MAKLIIILPHAENLDIKPGWYYCSCPNCCINNNKRYSDFQEAWKRCGEIYECKKILVGPSGEFYLRTGHERYSSNTRGRYIDYTTEGKKISY